MTQWKVAVYGNITEKTDQNYELMTREPKLGILMKIADVFQVSLDYRAGRINIRQANR